MHGAEWDARRQSAQYPHRTVHDKPRGKEGRAGALTPLLRSALWQTLEQYPAAYTSISPQMCTRAAWPHIEKAASFNCMGP
jgi:hypothetical protein